MRWTLPIAALLVASLAQAADAPPPGPGRYPMDADKDGFVTRDEAKDFPMLSAQFDAADTNKDGRLDAAEMDAHRATMHSAGRAKAQERWQAADTDGDGAISRAEAEASMPGVAERFKQFDVDKNGKIERAEMHQFRMRKKDRAGQSE
jgi:Ca2+-binding EF-hand superfamily protein